jgi:HAD superfamily hydrolase (TIGR01509 family)
MHELFGFPVDLDRDVDELITDFMARAGELTLKPGATALLEQTRGVYGLALASSSHRRLVHRSLDQFGLRPVFSVVVSGEDAPRPKPAPDLFLRAAELLGVPIGECVVLEDSIAGVPRVLRDRDRRAGGPSRGAAFPGDRGRRRDRPVRGGALAGAVFTGLKERGARRAVAR